MTFFLTKGVGLEHDSGGAVCRTDTILDRECKWCGLKNDRSLALLDGNRRFIELHMEVHQPTALAKSVGICTIERLVLATELRLRDCLWGDRAHFKRYSPSPDAMSYEMRSIKRKRREFFILRVEDSPILETRAADRQIIVTTSRSLTAESRGESTLPCDLEVTQ